MFFPHRIRGGLCPIRSVDTRNSPARSSGSRTTQAARQPRTRLRTAAITVLGALAASCSSTAPTVTTDVGSVHGVILIGAGMTADAHRPAEHRLTGQGLGQGSDDRLRFRPATGPNDPLFAQQWNLREVGMESAWSVTTGTEAVVAVLDTGILADPLDPTRTHPDLLGRVLTGFDFITDPLDAQDGDGRDTDPYDTPGAVNGTRLAHGTAVAGILGARTNDAQGAAGVSWAASILPVRVIGPDGGTLTDLIDGLLWAAGLPVAGTPVNTTPATVINLSLTARGRCPAALQQAIDDANALGVTVVAAAGNHNASASDSVPGNCTNVITVGATTREGTRASYTNGGPRIDVMAPGGDVSASGAGGVTALGVTGAGFGHVSVYGTSLAAPHVAGVVTLMRSVNPALTPSSVLKILRGSAVPLHPDQCPGAETGACGAGQLDAAAAVRMADAHLHVSAFSVTDPGVVRSVRAGRIAGSVTYHLGGLPAGEYRIESFVDVNGNGLRDPHEHAAAGTVTARVRAGQVQEQPPLHLLD